MKQLILIAAMGTMTGCTGLVSLNPIAGESEAIQDPGFAGVWEGKDCTFIVRPEGVGYRIQFVNKESARTFHGVLFQVGEAKLLDLVPQEEDPFQVAVHAVARVWTEPSKLRWAFLDTDWLKEEAQKALASQGGGERTVLTAPGAAVRGFLNKTGADQRAFQETETLDRVQ